MFSGIVGVGIWLNDKKIVLPDKIKNKRQAVLATGFSSYMNYNKEGLKKFILHIQEFKKVRLFGSAALSLAYVACGRVDAYYEKDIAFWDIAAGVILAKQSQKKVCMVFKDNLGDIYVE